jgi:ATP-binding cassette subfamily F protein 3
MSLITVSNLSKSFGENDVFRGLSFDIPPQARIAMVGPNGIGKTTLLRILIGLDNANAGRIHRARDIRIGYLPQERGVWGDEFTSTERTLWQECLSQFDDLLALENDLIRLATQLESSVQSNNVQELLENYGKLQADFERRGGYTYPTQIRQVLSGLGFSLQDYQIPLTHLSLGQRTRSVMARLLLSKPDLLILDEPTNHLDINAVEWLEGYLSQWHGSALIVSHDRYFLDKVCNVVWEMSAGSLEVYRGNYSSYLMQREQRWEERRQNFFAEKERLKKELEYVRRNIAGQNVTQAKGKLRRVSRIIEAIEQIGFEAVLHKRWGQVSQEASTSISMMGVDEATRRLNALPDPYAGHEPPKINLALRSWQRSGDLVLRSRDLVVGYPGRTLFSAPDLELRRLECAALIGPNGSGKTTFLKTLLNRVEPLRGEVILGASLHIGYFAQAHEDLRADCTLMQEIESVAPSMYPEQVRKHLARFLFFGDEVFKPVKTLSGGERGRLALAKLALEEANLLLLDEPTNHLDIPSQEILQSVLSDFQGTILLVSHDRYLIDRLATQIWEIKTDPTKVEEGYIEVFKGTYGEYRELEVSRNHENFIGQKKTFSVQNSFVAQKIEKNRQLAQQRKRMARLEELEKAITVLEEQINNLAEQLKEPPPDYTEVQQLGERFVLCQSELDTLYTEWEKLNVGDE